MAVVVANKKKRKGQTTPESSKDPGLESGNQADKGIDMSRSRGIVNGPDRGSGGTTMGSASRPLPTPSPTYGHRNPKPDHWAQLSSIARFTGANPVPDLTSYKLGSTLAGDSGRTNDQPRHRPP
ncbi:hypothetical protein U1Q18_003694 [Sarracenia purpurea var. burkii]